MSWYQLRRWIEYHGLDPYGEERDDLRAGLICSTITNNIRGIAAGMAGKKTFESSNPIDFMPFFKKKVEPKKPMTDEGWRRFKEQMLAIAKSSTLSDGN